MSKTETLKSWLYRFGLLSLIRRVATLSGAQRVLEQHRYKRHTQCLDHAADEGAPTVTNRAGIELVVDPKDLRARQLAMQGGALDHYLVQLWQRLVRELMPQLVLDVGANYGEILFGCEYPDDARIVGIEAKPRLVSTLQATIERNAIHGVEVLNCAVSDRSGPVSFITNEAWSG